MAARLLEPITINNMHLNNRLVMPPMATAKAMPGAALKKVVSIPVILTGGIKDAETAERLLQEGNADLIGVGRRIMSDSLWAKMAVEHLRGR